MWNLFIVGSLQFCNDSTIASLEANQNLPNLCIAKTKKDPITNVNIDAPLAMHI